MHEREKNNVTQPIHPTRCVLRAAGQQLVNFDGTYFLKNFKLKYCFWWVLSHGSQTA
jgi:hypothetical protein